jgi:hypothetical protein
VVANLLLSTLLTDRVGQELHQDIHANTYAALKELEHLTKLDYDQVKKTGRTRERFAYLRNETTRDVSTVARRPFFLSFVLDRAPHLGLRRPEAVIADGIFLQVFTPIMDNLAGELDNYEKNLEGLTRFPGELRDVGEGFTKNFGAFGAAAMVLPGSDLLEYCARRFAAEAIRSQITFGLDRAEPGDDRARALAKLAVDYSDPAFQRMSDAGREQVINASFIASVRELARQDENEELVDGYWYRLVESVDTGAVTGSDEKGEPIHAETLMDSVQRHLAESRQRVVNTVSIKDRSMFFPAEQVYVYIDYIAKLEDEVRQGHQKVDAAMPALQRAASEGEIIAALSLDPIAERYLVVRLLERCEQQWLAAAERQLEAAKSTDILESAAVRKRLREDIHNSLQRAANSKRLIGRDREFDQAKQEAQAEYTRTRSAALALLNAKIQLMQFRALLDYLRRRSRQYVRLATRMDKLVSDLEQEAERLRRGETATTPPLALRVEVLETLDEPRRRLWDAAYARLFLADGAWLNTFDRQVLARAISAELKPVVDRDGRVREKSVDQTVADLRDALCALGRERLKPRILGDGSRADPGLTIDTGLTLEAELVLAPQKASGDRVTEDEIAAYKTRKLRALDQIAGLLARVSSSDSRALDDGVIVNRTRQVISGLDAEQGGRAAEEFHARMVDTLSTGDRKVSTDTWHDPRLIIVHDVELPIPLYYFSAIVGDVETAYLKVEANERRGYHLHTDFNWEKSLPNLNPRRSELAVGWALRTFADGLVSGVFHFDTGDDAWVWNRPGAGARPYALHAHLAGTLYRLGELHGSKELREQLEQQLEQAVSGLGATVLGERRRENAEHFQQILNEINLQELDGDMAQGDALDRPILRALLGLLREAGEPPQGDGPSGRGSRYGSRFGISKDGG